MSTSELERRVIPRTAGEVRATGKGAGKNGIAGTAAVIGSLSQDLGGFKEEVSVGAFDKALKTSDIRALYNHSVNHILGRVRAGTAKVWADVRGLHYEVPDLPKSRADVLEAVERGDVTGCSFTFRVAERGDTWTTRNGQRIRTITEFAEIIDVGPVVQPAYTATTVSARALELARGGPAPVGATGARSTDFMAEEQRLLDALEADDAAADLAEAERQVDAERRRARDARRDWNIRALLQLADNDAAMRWVDQVAIHEAGHAFMYWIDGAGVDEVGLKLETTPARCAGGYARAKDIDARTAQASLAGIAAERLAGYDSGPLSDHHSDVTRARRELPSDRRSDADIEREIARAADVLQKRWWVVRALAREIKQKTELGGAEAEQIITRALGVARAA